MIKGKRYITMDLIRGISALLVCAGHLRAVMFVSGSELSSLTIIDKSFYFITSLGHQAVIIFFVLSGFFVGGSVLRKVDGFNFKSYLIDRLSRLWTPLVPALFFTLIIDRVISSIDPLVLTGTYANVLNSGPVAAEYSVSALTFISNVFFLQTVASPIFGTNGPLWSLAYEFWYYLLFPILLFVFARRSEGGIKRLILFLLAALLSLFVFHEMMYGFLIWLMGVIVYLVYQKGIFNKEGWLFLPALALFLLIIIDSKFHFLTSFMPSLNDLLVGLTFSILLFFTNGFEARLSSSNRLSRFSIWLSDISYSLYIFHFPIVMLFYALFYTKQQLEPSLSTMLVFGSLLFFLVIVSWGAWWLFESNTSYVRNLMNRWRTNYNSITQIK